jgi:hypothetical protein
MAMKKHVIDFANDSIELLQAHLSKLKKEEARLEIALTLREFPVVEDVLVRLTTNVVEIEIIERSIRLESTETTQQQVNEERTRIQAQIDAMKAKLVTLVNPNEATTRLKDYYTNRIKELEVTKFSAGMTKKNLKYLEYYERLLRSLRAMYDTFLRENKFPEHFDVFFHIPNLEKYLKVADDLIVQKGAA